jgi:hypothetical protein
MSMEFKQKLYESYGSTDSDIAKNRIKKDQVDTAAKQVKKAIPFRALDAKIAQNLMILLGSMKKTTDEVKEYIINMDEEHLSDENVQQLIKSMPASDQIKKLEQSRSDIDNLHPAEQTMLKVRLFVPIICCILLLIQCPFLVTFHQQVRGSFATLVVQDEL